jgi:hypothetical protein
MFITFVIPRASLAIAALITATSDACSGPIGRKP